MLVVSWCRQRLLFATLVGALVMAHALQVSIASQLTGFFKSLLPASNSLQDLDLVQDEFYQDHQQHVLDGSSGGYHDSLSTMDFGQYEDDVVLRFEFANVKERKAFVHVCEILVLDVWKIGKTEGDVRIQKTRVKDLLKVLPKNLRKNHKVLIIDLQRAVIDSVSLTKMEIGTDVSAEAEIFFKDYRDLDTIYAWMELLAQTYPQYVTLESIGTTFEGRDLKAVHIHSKGGSNVEKKTIVVSSGSHAREWISITSTLWTLYQLVTNSARGQERNFLEELDYLFIPVLNPDGYVYSWTHDRLWRKSRQDTGVDICKGIDLDHSFSYEWQASTGTPCSESYSGAYAEEALEARHFTDYINKTKGEGHKYYGFLDLHSYSQSILFPYAYSCDAEPRDEENLLELAYGLAKAIRWTSGKHFEVLPACDDREGLGGGSALDFMYHLHAIWAFQIKLRDTGNYGFLAPKKLILPSAKEFYNAFKYFNDFILNPE